VGFYILIQYSADIKSETLITGHLIRSGCFIGGCLIQAQLYQYTGRVGDINVLSLKYFKEEGFVPSTYVKKQGMPKK